MWRDVKTSKKVSRYKHMINVQSNVNMHLILYHYFSWWGKAYMNKYFHWWSPYLVVTHFLVFHMYSGGIMTHYLFKTVESDGGAPKASQSEARNAFHFKVLSFCRSLKWCPVQRIRIIISNHPCKETTFGNLSDYNVLESSWQWTCMDTWTCRSCCTFFRPCHHG